MMTRSINCRKNPPVTHNSAPQTALMPTGDRPALQTSRWRKRKRKGLTSDKKSTPEFLPKAFQAISSNKKAATKSRRNLRRVGTPLPTKCLTTLKTATVIVMAQQKSIATMLPQAKRRTKVCRLARWRKTKTISDTMARNRPPTLEASTCCRPPT